MSSETVTSVIQRLNACDLPSCLPEQDLSLKWLLYFFYFFLFISLCFFAKVITVKSQSRVHG